MTMVCDQSKGDSNSLMQVLGNNINKSVLLGVVDAVIGKSGLTREAIHQ